MTSKRLLIVTNLYPNPLEPTRGIFIQQLVERLKSAYEINVLCPLPWFPNLKIFSGMKKWHKFSQIPSRAAINGIDVHYPRYLVIPRFLGFLHSVFLYASILGKIQKMDKKTKIDLINAFWLFPDGIAAVWAARKLKIPVVISARGCDINLYKSFAFRLPQIKMALRSADFVTAMSLEQKHTIENLGIPAEKIAVIHNGIDFNKFDIKNMSECRNQLNLPQNKRIILYIGRFEEEKQVSYLIRAAARVRNEKKHDIQVELIGDGSLRNALKKEAKNLSLEALVTFRGEKKHEEIVKWMGASDLLCLPSKREGCPNVVLEALACGTPVVAPAVGAVPEIINVVNGCLYSINTVDSLTSSLFEALEKNWEKTKIRESVRSISWEKTAGEYQKIYTRILTREKGCVCAG